MIKARLAANMIILKDDVEDLVDHYKNKIEEKDILAEEMEKHSVELPHLSIEERKGVIKELKSRLNSLMDDLASSIKNDSFLKETRDDIENLLKDLQKANLALEKQFRDNPEVMNRYAKMEEDMDGMDFLSEKLN